MTPSTTDRVCKCCGAQFKARTADVNRGWALFCSKRCKAIKQEAATGQHSAYTAYVNGEISDFEQGWDAHKMEIYG